MDKRLSKCLLVSLLMVGFTASLQASTAGAETASLFSLDMLFKGINFIILLYLLYRFARKPIARLLSTSAENSKKAIDTALFDLEQAQKQLSDYQIKIANLESELAERQKSALASIDAEKAKMVAEAHEQARRLEEQAQKRIEQNLAKAKEEIKAFLISESVKLAEATLVKEIDAKSQTALIKNYTRHLKETA